MKDLTDPWRDLGEFIREQRNVARLSVRRLSDMAGISNPYLSQIERGLRRPSAEILQQIAKALRISAETLYVRAGILDARDAEGLTASILGEPTLTEDQKQTLLRIYKSFRRENDLDDESEPESGTGVAPVVPAGPVVPAAPVVPAGPVVAPPVVASGADGNLPGRASRQVRGGGAG
jgi:transcriptional regulator with XRE-family HTH domain